MTREDSNSDRPAAKIDLSLWEPSPAPIRYVPRSRAYYGSLGYGEPYRWAEHDDAPFTAMTKPLSECRVGVAFFREEDVRTGDVAGVDEVAALAARAVQGERAGAEHALADVPHDLPPQARAVGGEDADDGGRLRVDAGEFLAEQFALELVVAVGRERRGALRLGHRERRGITIHRGAGEEEEAALRSVVTEGFE